MIYIEKDTTNVFCLELSNLISTEYQYFLLGILWEGEIDKEWRAIPITDESLNPCRYNKFTIVESSIGDDNPWVISNEINLQLGQYKYVVWTSTEPFEEPVDWNNEYPPFPLDQIISTGRLIVNGEIESPYNSIIPDTNIPSVYD